MEIVWSSDADFDLDSLISYLQRNWNQTVIDNFLDKLLHYLILIEENPDSFPFTSDLDGVRKSVITKQNTIYFRVNQFEIEIIRLFDTRQSPEKLI